MKWFDVEKQTDLIDEPQLEVDLKFRIGRFTRWFVSNIFGRALSYLVGWTGTRALMLRCTAAGILKTAATGSGFEHNVTYLGTSVNAYVAIFPTTIAFSRVDIWITANDIEIQRAPDMAGFDTSFVFGDTEYYSFDCVTRQLELRSNVGGVHGTYRIIAWY